jgi:hypothetical protein
MRARRRDARPSHRRSQCFACSAHRRGTATLGSTNAAPHSRRRPRVYAPCQRTPRGTSSGLLCGAPKVFARPLHRSGRRSGPPARLRIVRIHEEGHGSKERGGGTCAHSSGASERITCPVLMPAVAKRARWPCSAPAPLCCFSVTLRMCSLGCKKRSGGFARFGPKETARHAVETYTTLGRRHMV